MMGGLRDATGLRNWWGPVNSLLAQAKHGLLSDVAVQQG